MTQFRADFSAIESRVKGKMKLLGQRVAQELANEMISGGDFSEGTPVGDPKTWKHPAPKDYAPGFARSNWAASIGVMGQGGNTDAVNGTIAELEIDQSLYLTNNAPYIRRLEFGHWSPQAPDGFVEPAARAFNAIVEKVAQDLEGK